MTNAIARRADVALFEACSQARHLTGKHRHEGSASLRIALELGRTAALG